VGVADQWGELQILMPEFDKFDAPRATLELVSEDRAAHRPEGLNTAVLPHAIQRVEPRRAELSGGGRDVEGPVACRAHNLASTRPKVPVELVGLVRCQRRQEGVPNSVPIQRRGLAESPRQEDTNGPLVDRLEQVRVPQEKHAKSEGTSRVAR
jgi:hypothetical protein